jgi:hypothetical protein
MAKISTPKTSVKIVEAEPQPVQTDLLKASEGPSASIIANILNYSKALEVKTSKSGNVIAVVKN